MRKYGIPYQGSKNSILKDICKYFPKAKNFYDVFGGGGSVTHFMLENRSKDYEFFHYNEIRSGVTKLFKDAALGKYNYKNFKPGFVTREEFFEKKDRCAYVRFCYSFGNDGRSYLFGKDIENYKHSLHNAIIFNRFDDVAKETLGISQFKDDMPINERRFFLRNRALVLNKDRTSCQLEQLQQLQQLERLEQIQTLEQLQQLQQLEQLQRLERLEQLERLERLERLDQLKTYQQSFENIEIESDSVVYCDIPYENTGGYDNTFNRDLFYEWFHDLKVPAFISEYNIQRSGIYKIWEKKVPVKMSAKGQSDKVAEKLYCNKIAYDKLLKRQ